MSVVSGRAGIGRQPIPGGTASGRSLDGDPDLERLRAEIQRNPLHGAPPRWPDVAEIATRLLAERSKDFRVACYLCVALVQTEQLGGLRDGLAILIDLFEHHWATGHPALPAGGRARGLALDWVVDRSTLLLRARTSGAPDRALLAECTERAGELAKLAGERFASADRAQALWGLAGALRELAERAVALEPPQTAPVRPTPSSAVTPAVTHAPATAGPSAAQSASATAAQTLQTSSPRTQASPARVSDLAIGARSEVPQLLLRASEYLRARHAASPLAYRIQRLARWGELETEPISRERRTELRGPAPEELSALRELAERGSGHALLAASEDVFWQVPLWLDLQRWSHSALRGLGADYAQAALGIEEDVRGLLHRIPGLARLCFSDGTPFADAATQRWIEETIRPKSAAPETTTAATRPAEVASTGPDPLEPALDAAREQARRGDAVGAIRALELAAQVQPGPRARFCARLALAAFCAELGRDRIALALLDELDAELQRHALDVWEPQLAARVLETAWRCQQRSAARDGAAETARNRADALYQRLCRLAPATATELA